MDVGAVRYRERKLLDTERITHINKPAADEHGYAVAPLEGNACGGVSVPARRFERNGTRTCDECDCIDATAAGAAHADGRVGWWWRMVVCT